MKAVCNVLRSTKSALELPNNYIATIKPTATPQASPFHSCNDAEPESQVHNRELRVLESLLTCSSSPPTALALLQNPPCPECSLPPLSSPPPNTCSDSNPLSINDAAIVYKNLYTLRAKWKTVGMFLCIPHHSLEAIRADNESCADRLTALIALWLRQITPSPTWCALLEAVQYIDQEKAREIMTNICLRKKLQ